jgi:hypothetical protein
MRFLQQETAMSNPGLPNTETQPKYPAVDMVLSAIASWVNHYRESAGLRDEFGQCDPAEVAQIAKDLNIPAAELRMLAAKGPGAADALHQMLLALKVDEAALKQHDPAVMRDLQRLCATCGHKQQCAHEIDVGTAAKNFHEFCPNAYTLDTLLKPAGDRVPELGDHLRG